MITNITVKVSGNALKRVLEMLKAPDRILAPLADIAAEEAGQRFANAQYDGTNDVRVTAEVGNDSARTVATGAAATFIEFGTGVYFNGSESYPGERPAGIAGIGEYGKGNGKEDAWRYYDREPGTNGELGQHSDGRMYVTTHGNPPAAAMYYGALRAKEEIPRIVKEAIE